MQMAEKFLRECLDMAHVVSKSDKQILFHLIF